MFSLNTEIRELINISKNDCKFNLPFEKKFIKKYYYFAGYVVSSNIN